MTFPVSVQTIILISFQTREVYIISTSQRLTAEAALCSICNFWLPPFAPLLPRAVWQVARKELRKDPGKALLAGFGFVVSLCWDQDAPLAQHKTFPSGFQLCRMQWCSQLWCSALGAVNEPSVCPGSAGTAWGIGSMPAYKMPSGLFLLPLKSIPCAETANLMALETKNNQESFYQPHCDV